jgi:hypothetical protein
VDDLLRYFSIRKAWDLRQYAVLSEDDLIFRNQAKERFAAGRFEHLYRGWKMGRTSDDQVRSEFPPDGKSHHLEFATEILIPAGSHEVNVEETR